MIFQILLEENHIHLRIKKDKQRENIQREEKQREEKQREEKIRQSTLRLWLCNFNITQQHKRNVI